jgi:hypothetical protein
MSPAPEAAKPRRRSLVDLAVLFLIGVVVVLVSLPRLRRFALRENEIDAIRAVRTLAEEALANAETGAPGNLAALFAATTGRRARLEDVEALPDGRLRRHGYVFDWIEGEEGGSAIVAWPWEHGRTGLAVFASEPGGPLLGLSNADGRYSGPQHPPPAPPHASAGDEPIAWIALRAE